MKIFCFKALDIYERFSFKSKWIEETLIHSFLYFDGDALRLQVFSSKGNAVYQASDVSQPFYPAIGKNP